MFDDKTLISIGLAVTSALVGWLFKNIFERINRNELSVRELENKISRDFQSKETAQLERKHTEQILSDIRDNLKGINQKLDKKEDKKNG